MLPDSKAVLGCLKRKLRREEEIESRTRRKKNNQGSIPILSREFFSLAFVNFPLVSEAKSAITA
jgi:hypothetical protein